MLPALHREVQREEGSVTRVIGIDQGLTGGIAYLEREPGGRVHRLTHASFATVKHCGRNEIDDR